jgi:hypothetical protein
MQNNEYPYEKCLIGGGSPAIVGQAEKHRKIREKESVITP